MKLYSNLAVNNIVLKPFPFQMELVMEAFLVENPLVLSFDGETAPEIIACEIPLKKGRKSSDGRIDIVALYPDGIIAVIELKNHSIDEDAYNQLGEYLNQRDVLQEILIQTGKIEQEHIDDYKWIGVLVGTENLSRTVEEKIKKEKLNNQFPCIALILNRYKTDNSAQTFI